MQPAQFGNAFSEIRNFSLVPVLIRPSFLARPLRPMDSLIAKADAVRPLNKKRKNARSAGPSSASPKKPGETDDKTLHSLAHNVSLPRSLRASEPLPEGTQTHSHIANKRLRTKLDRQSAHNSRAKALVQDTADLLADDVGALQVEGELERTWRVGQAEIGQGAGEEAAKGRREWKLDSGPYRCRYTRNGRCVLLSKQECFDS